MYYIIMYSSRKLLANLFGATRVCAYKRTWGFSPGDDYVVMNNSFKYYYRIIYIVLCITGRLNIFITPKVLQYNTYTFVHTGCFEKVLNIIYIYTDYVKRGCCVVDKGRVTVKHCISYYRSRRSDRSYISQ